MIHIWLAHNQGSVRVFLNKKWQVVETWQDVGFLLKKANIKDEAVCLYAPTVNFIQTIKPMTKAQLKQLGTEGLQYLLENDVLGNVEELFVKNQLIADNQVLLCAINKNLVQSFEQSLELVGLKLTLQVVLPDYMLLHELKEETEATLYIDSDTALLRHYPQYNDSPETNTSSIETTSNNSTNQKTSAKNQKSETIKSIGTPVDDVKLILTRLPNLESIVLQTDGLIDTPQDLYDVAIANEIQLFSSNHVPTPIENPERHLFNMMPRKNTVTISPYAKVVLGFACITFCLLLAYDGMRTVKFKKLENDYQQQIYKQYKQWFPNERPPLDVEKTIKSKTFQTNEQSGVMFSAFTTASTMMRQNNLDAKRIILDEKVITIHVMALDLEELKNLVNGMTGQGLAVSLGNASTKGDMVEGVIKIQL